MAVKPARFAISMAASVRDRDTMQQERISIAELFAYLRERLS